MQSWLTISKASIVAVLMLAAVFATTMRPLPARAASECDSFAQVIIWSDINHQAVASFVERTFDGDWGEYADRLTIIKKRIEEIYGRDEATTIKMQGERVLFEGPSLAQYIKDSEARIDIVRCLGEEAMAAGLDNFSTAAGGESPLEPEQE